MKFKVESIVKQSLSEDNKANTIPSAMLAAVGGKKIGLIDESDYRSQLLLAVYASARY